MKDKLSKGEEKFYTTESSTTSNDFTTTMNTSKMKSSCFDCGNCTSTSLNKIATNEDYELKLMMQNNEILKLKSLLSKKNKKLEEYEKLLEKYKTIENELNATKSELMNITKSIKTSRLNSKESTFDRLSIISGDYDMRSAFHVNNNEKLKLNFKSMQTDLEISKMVESKLKKKLEEMNIEVIEMQKKYAVKDKEFDRLRSLINTTNSSQNSCVKLLYNFTDFLDNNITQFQNIHQFFNVFAEENKKTYLSELFEGEFDFNNLNHNNYKIFINKINNLNYIIKLDEQLNFNQFFYNQVENEFTQTYNDFVKNFLQVLQILLKTLMTENTKIFYFVNNLNNLMKLKLLSGFDYKLVESKFDILNEFFKNNCKCSMRDEIKNKFTEHENKILVNNINIII
jgi:hypothetical protein